MNERSEALIAQYGSSVFNDSAMRKYLPGDTYKQLKKIIDQGKPMSDPALADIVANGLKRWAMDNGATHYTHWFQPLTGATAEKHESFIDPQKDGSIDMRFSGKELVRGEGDASSFPSGGLRGTFEARGYTAWDCTSPAFVKENTLYIPTCFCSFTGEVLDKKTPLLRSMEAISKQAVRVAKLMGVEQVTRVIPMAGAEQEYFLVDKALFSKRLDLAMCGRTLFGAKPAKGQELDDHYYGNIKERVMEFMRQVDEELWRLGVPAKTEHNEAAPAQHELAPVYATTNIACDQNQLTMETLKKVALRNNFVCLLHEKPFAGLNGSGKHNNWSLNIDGGKSLLDPGKTPESNARFLLFTAAVLWAVDEYADLLRMSIAGAGNDHRLGGHEAPPAIISVYLGDLLTDVFREISTGGESVIRQGGNLKMGVTTIPTLPTDGSDRNRTSPFAFTGKKFEFRMVGSSQSIADCNIVLNTIVADILQRIGDRLENCDNIQEESRQIVREIIRDHGRIIFNGNNYSKEWREEAARRGLPNIPDSVQAAEALIKPQNMDLFMRHGVFSPKEMESRYEVMLESYAKTMNIEACTMLEMTRREIVPAAISYSRFLSETLNQIKDTGLAVDVTLEAGLLKDVTAASAQLRQALSKLEKTVEKASGESDTRKKADLYRQQVLPAMDALRAQADRLETLLGKEYWPMPTYTELLYGNL